jgi:hypothetical protein
MGIHIFTKYTVFTEPPEPGQPQWFASLDTSDDEGQEEVYGYGTTEKLAIFDLFRQLPDADPVPMGVIEVREVLS